jgi:hypothetical protein
MTGAVTVMACLKPSFGSTSWTRGVSSFTSRSNGLPSPPGPTTDTGTTPPGTSAGRVTSTSISVSPTTSAFIWFETGVFRPLPITLPDDFGSPSRTSVAASSHNPRRVSLVVLPASAASWRA